MRIAIARLSPLDQEDLDAIIPEVVAAFVPLAQAYESYFEMFLVRSERSQFSNVPNQSDNFIDVM